ncbi:glycine betaine/L-proline ABC transporter, ATPase subunit [Caldalkalibacillus thermarum TA2.A1]|uniref:Quaternary amine transport ATP-binding protein n=1 Tax=Caldalkalibacillus thermarum (strain TA2.A1) TaxID=986075 RepID=F5L5C2_CALTT|nr:glycine betaine/L-proline ABC transporter ATP-binding protein [Caldalkalibacillus thermarum]EGL83457.1 glycine betaine/L-proline ABC transporter, ATPase subunit [Caldalkalibacillus thermarum TA2.A1]QZT34922.1 glycine betaine/L-proline ABC transporter ATP-binding protein [Caldalkalibacillus thermarum TA2.A1]
MSKIAVEEVTKIFGRETHKALALLQQGKSKADILQETGCTVGVNRATFEVHEGEIFVIMGLSGSGKSTLVRLINRLIEPTSGSIRIDGEDIVQMKPDKLRDVRRKKVSMVFQRFALFPHRTVLENVAYGLEVQGVDPSKRQEAALQALKLVGLQGWEEQYPDQLSGGMQQRVGLARALANDPDILLMDEAFSALDPLIRKDMQDELLELQAQMKKTIVFITHDLDEALRLGDRIALMKDGQIVQIGTPEEILMHPANHYVERFVEDVDLSKVLRAGQVMKRAEAVTLGKDGLRVALKRMQDQGLSSIYVIDRHKVLVGALTADQALQALKDGQTDMEEIMIREIPTADPSTPLYELFERVYDTAIPLAVVDDKQRLRGVVVRGAILAALAGNGGKADA